MVGHGGSSAGSHLADPTSPIPSHCALIVATSTVRVKLYYNFTPPYLVCSSRIGLVRPAIELHLVRQYSYLRH